MSVQLPKSQFVSGESVVVSLAGAREGEAVYVVFTQGLERKVFDCVPEGGAWVACVDSAELGLGEWCFTLWRAAAGRREVVQRGALEVVDESSVLIDPISRARMNIEVLKNARIGIFSTGIKRNKVRDREVERFSPAELLEELRYWEAELYRLEVAAGIRKRRNLRFRF